MTQYVIPNESFEATLDTGEPGIAAELGTTILDNVGGTTQAYNDAGITEIAPGFYAATRTAPSSTGQFSVVWRRGSAIDDDVMGGEDLVVSGSIVPSTIPTDDDEWRHGPCAVWIDGADVADCCDADAGSDTTVFDDVAEMASTLLFGLTARQFNGVCQRTVRPCTDICSRACFDFDAPFPRTRCGCQTESRIRLAGYPIRSIVSVKIDGDIIDESEYRLEEHRSLLRLHDAGPPVRSRVWPSCQNLALADDQDDTFAITYTYGMAPPELGKRAAAQLACELWKACPGNAGECALPNKVTRIVRQGVTIEKIVPLADFLKEGATGLTLVDAFMAQVNPHGARRRSAVWSPDLPRYPRRTS